jgi:Holliday junction resolvasome RuvABC endonuclease subunit
MKYLIGLDVGYAKMGASIFRVGDKYAQFVDSRFFSSEKESKKQKTRVDSDHIRRVSEALEWLDYLLIHISNDVFVSAEFPTAGTKSKSAAMAFGLATGLLLGWLHIRQIPYEHVTPQEVKFIATGRKQNVSKEQVQKGMSILLKRESIVFGEMVTLEQYLKSLPIGHREHVADSIAVAWWSVRNSSNFRSFVS